MLAANILANSCRIGASSAAVSALVTRSTIPYLSCSCSPYQRQTTTTATPQLPHTSQQLRFIRKTFRFRYAFGEKPLYTDHMYNEAVDEGRLDELGYKQIRFAASYETNSPLQDDMVEKYINYILYDGRRGLKYQLLHNTFYQIKSIQYKRMLKRKQAEMEGKQVKKLAQTDDSEEDKIELNPVELFHKAIKNCTPLLITRKVKRGGATYQVPYPVVAKESEFLAIRWLHDMIKDRPKPRLVGYDRELARELIDAAHSRGKVVKKKDDIHKLAQTNKAYAHYRWG